MRPNRAIWTLCACAAAAIPAPALAAAPDEPTRAGAGLPQPERVARSVVEVSREARQRQHRRQAQDGPFHPLSGTPDYGTADNAFGASRDGHIHAGQDVFAPPGTPLVAVTDTTVADAGADGAQGNFVHLYDEDADQTYVYMHMIAPPDVKPGQRVEAGDRLGGVGCTGSCWGDHLHFEVREGKGFLGEAQDPMPLLERWDQPPR